MKTVRRACRELKRRGSALVVVLALIVILSVIIVTLTVAMRMERQAAHYYAERAGAELLAQEGVASAKAKILEATGADRQWISMPGRIVSTKIGGEPGDPPEEPVIFDLFSAAVGAAETDAADINRRVLSDDSLTAVTGSANAAGEEMKVGWIYVRTGGQRVPAADLDTSDTNNPIIGRFAYWTDDETARVNLNTAWKNEDNTNSMNHPSHVDLTALGLTAEQADAIHSAALTSTFNSPDGARRLDPDLAEALSRNRFFVSHCTSSSDKNPWGEPKIVLTTKRENLPPGYDKLGEDVTNYYLNILKDENQDPGIEIGQNMPNIDVGAGGKYAANLNKIMAYLDRDDWPYGQGSFVDKYGYLNCVQIAMDILEYVRAVESTNNLLVATRFTAPSPGDPGNDTFDFNSVISDRTLRANPRNIMITEVAMWLHPTPVEVRTTTAKYKGKEKIELYLPNYPGQPPVDLDGVMLYFVAQHENGWEKVTRWFLLSPENTTPSATIQPGGYVTVEGPEFKTDWMTDYPETMKARMILYLPDVPPAQIGNYRIWDIASSSKQSRIPMTINGGTTPTWTVSSQVNDPRVNKFAANWTAAVPSTFGSQNGRFGEQESVSSPGEPPQDTLGGNGTGAVSTEGLFRPAKKGSEANPHGLVRSVAELGNVHTGIAANVPFRTLRLQPTPGVDTNTLPDWALLELFTAPLQPVDSPPLVKEITAGIPGRININARIEPFAGMRRSAPIEALFKGNTNLTDAQAATAATNTFERTYSGVNYGGTNGFVSVGELAEIAGVADEGEASEMRLHGAVDLAATQGKVFRVYAVGQALKQTPAGDLPVQAEKSVMAVIEKEEETCRTVFFRSIPY